MLSDELTEINVYAHKTALFDVESFLLYRDLDTLSVPFDGCYMYFIDNYPDKYWSYSARLFLLAVVWQPPATFSVAMASDRPYIP